MTLRTVGITSLALGVVAAVCTSPVRAVTLNFDLSISYDSSSPGPDQVRRSAARQCLRVVVVSVNRAAVSRHETDGVALRTGFVQPVLICVGRKEGYRILYRGHQFRVRFDLVISIGRRNTLS